MVKRKKDEEQTHEYNNQIKHNQLSLWGILFEFNKEKLLFHEEFGKVGQIRFPWVSE